MVVTVRLVPTSALPHYPRARAMGRLALVDREALGLRIGEPCDPRTLASVDDVSRIVEHVDEWARFLRLPQQQVIARLRADARP